MRRGALALVVSIGLLFWASRLGDGGHDFLMPFWLLCAPLPVQLGVDIVLAAPFFWFGMGFSTSQGPRWCFPVLMTAHYVVAIFEILHYDLQDLAYLEDTLVESWFWGCAYLFSTGLLWMAWIETERGRRRRNGDYHKLSPLCRP